MINIVIPMAGKGSRFSEAGYRDPKPLIPVHGRPMIEVVIENLRPTSPHHFIFICQRQHISNYALNDKLYEISPGCDIIPIDEVTDGAACTVLLAKHLINNDTALVIANCDQYVDIDINDYYRACESSDGLIMTMPSDHPKWSYVKYDQDGEISGVVEKEVVSGEATVGIYHYRNGSDFVYHAEKMISDNERVNNEFYVAPVYSRIIKAGRRIESYNIDQKMYGLGVPSDLDLFLSLDVSNKTKL